MKHKIKVALFILLIFGGMTVAYLGLEGK